jgi:hypothetical protein
MAVFMQRLSSKYVPVSAGITYKKMTSHNNKHSLKRQSIRFIFSRQKAIKTAVFLKNKQIIKPIEQI